MKTLFIIYSVVAVLCSLYFALVELVVKEAFGPDLSIIDVIAPFLLFSVVGGLLWPITITGSIIIKYTTRTTDKEKQEFNEAWDNYFSK